MADENIEISSGDLQAKLADLTFAGMELIKDRIATHGDEVQYLNIDKQDDDETLIMSITIRKKQV